MSYPPLPLKNKQCSLPAAIVKGVTECPGLGRIFFQWCSFVCVLVFSVSLVESQTLTLEIEVKLALYA